MIYFVRLVDCLRHKISFVVYLEWKEISKPQWEIVFSEGTLHWSQGCIYFLIREIYIFFFLNVYIFLIVYDTGLETGFRIRIRPSRKKLDPTREKKKKPDATPENNPDHVIISCDTKVNMTEICILYYCFFLEGFWILIVRPDPNSTFKTRIGSDLLRTRIRPDDQQPWLNQIW